MAGAFETRKRMIVNEHPPGRGVLTPQEISILLKEELSLELGLATAGYFEADRDDVELARSHRIYSAAYRIAARNGGEREVSDEERRRLKEASWAVRDIRAVELILKYYCSAEEGEIERRLRNLSLKPSPSLVRQARVQLLRARAEAQDRAALFPAIESEAQFDPVDHLLNMKSARSAPIQQIASPEVPRAEPTPDRENADCPFVSNDRRNLSAIAREICDGLVTDKVWREPALQQKRIVSSFIWISGDKAIGDYRQDDAADFKRKLQRLSSKFRWGHEPGAQFNDILTGLPEVDEKTRRNPKTVNRDLSTMSTFYEAMRKAGPWSTADERTKVGTHINVSLAPVEA